MDLQSAKHHPVLDLSMPLTELEVESKRQTNHVLVRARVVC